MEVFLKHWETQGFTVSERSAWPGEYELSKKGFHTVYAMLVNGFVCVFFEDGRLMGKVRNQGTHF